MKKESACSFDYEMIPMRKSIVTEIIVKKDLMEKEFAHVSGGLPLHSIMGILTLTRLNTPTKKS